MSTVVRIDPGPRMSETGMTAQWSEVGGRALVTVTASVAMGAGGKKLVKDAEAAAQAAE